MALDHALSLRERKKLRTREALVDAAFDLFQRKGFEAATVDEIAEAVEVSPRTFFRYFTGKDDLLLALQDQQYALLVDLIIARPAHESMLDVLRHAAVEMMQACEAGDFGLDPRRFACLQELMTSSPALAARCREHGAARINDLAAHLAGRMGVAVDDPRPFLVASVATAVLQVALTWHDQDPGTPLSEFLDRAFRLLGDGVNYPAYPAVQ